jgi:hypothetical protein
LWPGLTNSVLIIFLQDVRYLKFLASLEIILLVADLDAFKELGCFCSILH